MDEKKHNPHDWWDIILKVFTVIIPLVTISYVPWVVWVTNGIYESKSQRDMATLNYGRISDLEKTVDTLKTNQVRILTVLERIETKVGSTVNESPR